MALQACRSLLNNGRLLKIGARGVVARLAHHDTSVKPINEPPNEHLPFRPAILDDLPEPQGDWLEDYNKRSKRYWMHFFFGLTCLSSTVFFMLYNEVIFWNLYFPEMPPKEERIKSFWDPAEDDEDEDDED